MLDLRPRTNSHEMLASLHTAVATAVLSVGLAGAPEAFSQTTLWQGVMTLRGDSTPVRLSITGQRRERRAALDVPRMLMAGVPLPTKDEGRLLQLTMPFGLGDVRLTESDELLVGEGRVGSDTLRLELRPTRPPPYAVEAVSVKNGNVTLNGALAVPRSPGRHPAVVLVHGSGDQGLESWEYASHADYLARLGVAVLYYDKRGVGGSTGAHWGDDINFEGLASDVIAAVDELASRPHVDASRIGLLGGSQAGWVMLLAASRSDRIRFLVLQAAPSVTPLEQMIQQTEYSMRAAGRAAADIQDALAHMRLYGYTAHTGRGWELLRASVEEAKNEPWAEYVLLPQSSPHTNWMGRHHAFDPAPCIGRLRIPTLVFYGDRDTTVPPTQNADRFRWLLRESVAPWSVHIIAGADHRLERASGRDAAGRWHWFHVAPDYFTILEEWLARRGFRPARK